jgi:hypothetical protein
VPAEILVERVVGRRMDPQTGAIYHLKYKPPPPEVVPRLVQRSDDTEEKVRRAGAWRGAGGRLAPAAGRQRSGACRMWSSSAARSAPQRRPHALAPAAAAAGRDPAADSLLQR